MAKTTTNLGLIKPERSDNYSVDVMSGNMDIIDAKIAALEAGEFETVNCTGAITADSVNGVVLKSSGTITVTPISTVAGYLPYYVHFILLPPRQGVTYTGSIIFKSNKTNMSMSYYNGKNSHKASSTTINTSDTTYSFNDIPYLIVQQPSNGDYYIQYNDFTLT